MTHPFEYARSLSKEGVFINFYGPISQSVLVELGSILKQKLYIENASHRTTYRVFSLLVEQAQNILSYIPSSNSQPAPFKNAIISIGNDKNSYFIITSNKVNNKDIPFIQSKLQRIETLSNEELKNYHRHLRKGMMTESKTFNELCLVEMAKKSTSPLEFFFKKADADHSFFFLKSTVEN